MYLRIIGEIRPHLAGLKRDVKNLNSSGTIRTIFEEVLHTACDVTVHA